MLLVGPQNVFFITAVSIYKSQGNKTFDICDVNIKGRIFVRLQIRKQLDIANFETRLSAKKLQHVHLLFARWKVSLKNERKKTIF